MARLLPGNCREIPGKCLYVNASGVQFTYETGLGEGEGHGWEVGVEGTGGLGERWEVGIRGDEGREGERRGRRAGIMLGGLIASSVIKDMI